MGVGAAEGPQRVLKSAVPKSNNLEVRQKVIAADARAAGGIQQHAVVQGLEGQDRDGGAEFGTRFVEEAESGLGWGGGGLGCEGWYVDPGKCDASSSHHYTKALLQGGRSDARWGREAHKTVVVAVVHVQARLQLASADLVCKAMKLLRLSQATKMRALQICFPMCVWTGIRQCLNSNG